MEKKCFKCHEIKDISDFYVHQEMADGHLGKCKECTKKDVHKRYDTHPDLIKEYEKKRWKNPKRRKKAVIYLRLRRRRNKLMTKAYNKTRSKKFQELNRKLPCEICGDLKSQKHHPDYSEPMKIEWLCRKHHLEKHGKKCWV